MFCGSCMHDNAIAKALIARGNDCLLQPVYTPIRTDDSSVASERLFFGGIHVYLTQKMPWLRRLPAPVRRLLDSPALLRSVTAKMTSTDAILLGDLAVSMLRGVEGRQGAEAKRLVRWISEEVKPDAIVLSNLLIGGVLPSIRASLPEVKIAVMLQGDDIFLSHLPEPQQSQAIELCRSLVQHVDLLISNSHFYANKMGELLAIDSTKLRHLPLSIDTTPFDACGEECADSQVMSSQATDDRPHAWNRSKHTERFDLGYLARISPEKGLHHLVDVFIRTATDVDTHLHVAGWLGENNRVYWEAQQAKIEAAGLSARFTHHGSPTLPEKVSFLSGLDLLCVPTQYEEPKGLFVLEALAAGTPVLQPEHGAFGELLKATQGGITFKPLDADHLAKSLIDLVRNPDLRRELGTQGRRHVLESHNINVAAERLESILFAK